jgi:cytochrome bd-type quinol oxidase subunit 2
MKDNKGFLKKLEDKELLNTLREVRENKWLKIGRFVMLAVGLFFIFVAPQKFSTIPTGLFYMAEVLIALFAGSALFFEYFEYYLKETKKGWRERRKAIITGVFIIVLSISVFVGVHFSGLPEKILPQYYDNEQPAELNEAP